MAYNLAVRTVGTLNFLNNAFLKFGRSTKNACLYFDSFVPTSALKF